MPDFYKSKSIQTRQKTDGRRSITSESGRQTPQLPLLMPDDLQIRENTRFQERVWRFKPVIWCLMLLFVGIGVFGGAGPLNQTSVHAPPIKIEFERFPIKTIPSSVTVEIDTEAVSDDKIELWLDNDYLTRMVLRQFYPEPEKTESREGGTVFTFSVAQGETANISFIFEPHSSGRATTDYRFEGIGTVKISHLVYP